MDFKKILFKTTAFDVEKSLPDALVVCAKDGTIQWVNDVAAEIFETSKINLLTSNIENLIENSMMHIHTSVTMHRAVITKLVEKEQYYDMTAREAEEGYVLDFRDASTRSSQEKNEDAPEVINREKNNFLIKLSNDLKSPLQSIVGFSQAMADGLGGNLTEQQEKYIRIINKNSSDLMYFIGKLLEHAQTETNDKLPDKKPLDIVALVNAIVKFNEQLYTEKEIEISVKSEDGFKKTISSDSEILKNIFQDLLEVIVKSVDIGAIDINLSNPSEEFLSDRGITSGNYVLVSLSSSALLLSESDLDCMFDPYKIVDTANRKNVLRAIVLESVKNMIQSLGGTIWVTSQILKSTTFYILLPV